MCESLEQLRRITRIHVLLLIALIVFVLWTLWGWHAETRDARVDVCLASWSHPNATLLLSTLPKIIHQQIGKASDVPLHLAKWRAQMIRVFPASDGYTHILWTDESQRAFIEKHYGWFLDSYDAFPEYIMRSDAFRVFALYHFGGVYMDMDYEVLENFWDKLPDDAPAAVESPHPGERLQNAFMSSPAKHDFWKVYWDVMSEKVQSHSPIDATGPRALDAAVARFPRRFVMLPCVNWNRAPRGSDLSESRTLAALAQNFYVRAGFKKDCGSTLVRKCLAGIHHGVYSWAKIKV